MTTAGIVSVAMVVSFLFGAAGGGLAMWVLWRDEVAVLRQHILELVDELDRQRRSGLSVLGPRRCYRRPYDWSRDGTDAA